MPYYYDIDLLEKYWVERPMTYHHTMPILQYYALYRASGSPSRRACRTGGLATRMPAATSRSRCATAGYELLPIRTTSSWS